MTARCWPAAPGRGRTWHVRYGIRSPVSRNPVPCGSGCCSWRTTPRRTWLAVWNARGTCSGAAAGVRGAAAGAGPASWTGRSRPLSRARGAAQDVAGRLDRAGSLTRVRSRVPGRRGRCVPVDSDWAFASLLRVRSALDPARPFAAHEAALAGLAVASGLGFRLDQYLPPAGRSPQEAVALLGPDLRELIAQTQAAVDSALLSHRT